jgi:hypothetical protein
MRYVQKSEQSISRQKTIKKFGNGITVKNNYLDGEISISNYRRYSCYEEVDVVFNGKIYARLNLLSEWFNSEILSDKTKKVP